MKACSAMVNLGRWSLALGVAAGIAAGCTPKRGAAPAGSTLRLAQVAEPTTLDPGKVQDGATIEVLMSVFEGLVQWNEKNELQGAAAEKWEVSADGRTYTFHLRDGVKFHNGRAVTADDFVYSMTRSLFPKEEEGQVVGMSYLDDIVGVREYRAGKAAKVAGLEAPDERTLRITIDKPKAYFLAKLTYPTSYAVCKEALEAEGGEVNKRSMIGTGPFKLDEYAIGDRIILAANADYWEGAPKLQRVERRILTDQNTRHDKFEAGELDIAPEVTMASYKGDVNNPELKDKIKLFPRPSIYYMVMNQGVYAPFKDKRVRQAFALAVDRAQIVRTVHQGVPQVAEGIVPPGVPGHNAAFKGLGYDPAKAKGLLAAAGFAGGKGLPPLKLSFRASVEDIRNTAVAIAADLEKNLGVSVELDETEWTTFLARRARGELPFSFLRWGADYLDPQNFLSTMLHTGAAQNRTGYSNPEFDRLCDQADMEQDAAKRWKIYGQAEAIAVDDAPWAPFYFQKDVELWNPKLRGVEDMALGHLPHKRTYFEP